MNFGDSGGISPLGVVVVFVLVIEVALRTWARHEDVVDGPF